MSNFLRFSIFFGVLTTCLCHNVRDDVPWFKERERITDRFLVGMINGRNTRCNTHRFGGEVEGTCLPARECTNLNGIKGSACSFLGTCCVLEKTCQDVTRSKLSYFVAPKNFQSLCSLTVKPMNRNVCQIRLDFVKFSIAQPTKPYDLDSEQGKSYQCYDDAFTVTGSDKFLGFEHLCGENAKQHIYIPVINQTDIVLTFKLSSDLDHIFSKSRDWRIQIRQLECPGLSHFDVNDIHSSLTTMHHHHNPHYNSNPSFGHEHGHGHYHSHSHSHRPSTSDHYLIAPYGCLQYYTEKAGYYESFNFNGGKGPYIGKTHYAICFKKTPDICGIRHTAKFFVMNYNLKAVGDQYEVECHRRNSSSEATSNDSLHIPGGILNNELIEYFCDEQLSNQATVTSTLPESLNVVVRTDEYRPLNRVEIGFKIAYEMMHRGCISSHFLYNFSPVQIQAAPLND